MGNLDFRETVNGIFLVLNADNIRLSEWFDSIAHSAPPEVDHPGIIALGLDDPSQGPVSKVSVAFDMDQLRVADLFAGDLGSGSSGKPTPGAEAAQPLCRVMDPYNSGLMEALAA
ncbi:MAG: hypothetical protein AB1646_22260 [Thermodesulfobacteriota bacterium]